MRCIMLLVVVLASGSSTSWAALFTFDLTSLVGDNLVTQSPEVEVDLGFQFDQITSAKFILAGVFHPGKSRAVGPEPNTNPIINSAGSIIAITRVGEIGTAPLEKELFSSLPLAAEAGDVLLELPLLEVDNDGSTHITLFPPVVPASNFDFLLDGRFGLSVGTLHIVAALYEIIENPRLEVAQFSLEIEGVAIPEPRTLLFVLLGVACLVYPRWCLLF